MLVVLVGIGVAVADPFAGRAASHNSNLDNGSPTSTQRVRQTSLASQTQVNGTLGYGHASSIRMPAGTPPETPPRWSGVTFSLRERA